jgi:hypothetical protein
MAVRKTTIKVKKSQLYRSVASSSAIETGQSVKIIERKLKSQKSKFSDLALAV